MEADRMSKQGLRKDTALDDALVRFNAGLRSLMLGEPPMDRERPQRVIFLVGLQRSGTTLAMQLLANSFQVTYPDNIVARFWEAPHLGLLVSRSLRQHSRNAAAVCYESTSGVAPDVFGPHEFGNFWSKWFGFEPTHELSEAQLQRIDIQGMKDALHHMELHGTGPLLFKVVPLSMNATFLAEVFPDSFFIYSRRDLLFVAQSTYQNRLKRYGTLERWWSLKPNEYDQLKELEPIDQVAGQVCLCDNKIVRQMERIAPGRVIVTDYTALCDAPHVVVQRIQERIPWIRRTDLPVPQRFEARDAQQIGAKEFDSLRDSLMRARTTYRTDKLAAA